MRSERYFDRRPTRGDWLEDRPLGELLRDFVQESQTLAREELRHAKEELRAEAAKAKRGAAALGAGGALSHAALLLLGATLVLVGATFLAAWVSALIVTLLYAIAGGALLSYGKKELRRTDPSRPVESIREDARWAKETMRDIRWSRRANA